MSRFLDWLTRIGSRQADQEIDAIAVEVFQDLRWAPEPHDPKPLTDGLIRGAMARRPAPTDEQLGQLRARIKALSDRQRVVLKLMAIDRLTYKEIAARLGITNHVALRELSAAMHALSMPRPEQ